MKYNRIIKLGVLFVRKNERKTERKKEGKKVALNESGNLTISLCNEAGGLFGAEASGALWVVGVRLCGIGKVVERKKALKFEEKSKEVKKVEEVINMLPLGVGGWRDRREGWRVRRGKLPLIP